MSSTKYLQPKVDRLAEELAEIELGVVTEGYTLAQAMREGAANETEQNHEGFINPRGMICALSAAYVSAKARGLI